MNFISPQTLEMGTPSLQGPESRMGQAIVANAGFRSCFDTAKPPQVQGTPGNSFSNPSFGGWGAFLWEIRLAKVAVGDRPSFTLEGDCLDNMFKEKRNKQTERPWHEETSAAALCQSCLMQFANAP